MTGEAGMYDVVVIGAGHNGLACACYLADAGLDVIVVEAIEAIEAIGEMTSSGPGIPGAPGHTVDFCAADLVFWQASPVADELRLAEHGLRSVLADPAWIYLDPDGASLAFWQDIGRTAAEVARFSAADAEAYVDYVRLLGGLSTSPGR